MYRVQWHPDAVAEFEDLSDPRLRVAVLTVVGLLEVMGPRLGMPQCRQVKGTRDPKLWELRPRGGQSVARPIYIRLDDTGFVIVAIAPESMTDKKGFARALAKAQRRASDLWPGSR